MAADHADERPTPTAVALCGAGRVAAVHALAVEATPWLTLRAVASRQPAHARALAESAGAFACTYDALPGDAGIVIVATPPRLHALDTIRALQGGAGVIVEQPVAATLDDADRIVDAAEASQNQVAYAANLAFAPLFESLRFELPDIGAVQHLEVRALQAPPDRPDAYDPDWGGGALLRTGTSVIALAMLLAAPNVLTEVHTRRLEADTDDGVDTHAEVELRFGAAVTANVTASWRQSVATWDVQAASAFGVLRAELLPQRVLERNGEALALPEIRTDVVPTLDEFGYLSQMASLAGSLRAGSAPAIDAAFGRAVLEVVCAAYRSAATGVEEAVPFTGPRHFTPHQLWRGR
jgi:predicted dehydrogenase